MVGIKQADLVSFFLTDIRILKFLFSYFANFINLFLPVPFVNTFKKIFFMKKKRLFVAALFFVLSSHAQIRLPNVLSNGMVLQQNSTVNLWGWASPAEKISIQPSWTKDTLKAVTDGNGKWNVKVNTPKGGGPYQIIF